MIPIPQAGILRRVEGVLAAGKVPYIEEVVIHVREGYELVPCRRVPVIWDLFLRARRVPRRRRRRCAPRTPACAWW